MTNKKQGNELSFEAQAAQAIKDEATAIANGIQKPGQSKEETKLIAQGIAKGIESYKKKESAKQRDRAKEQKRLKAEAAPQAEEEDSPSDSRAQSAKRLSKIVRYSSNFAAILAFLHFWAMLTPRDTLELNLHWIPVAAATLGVVYLIVSFLLLKVAKKLTS